MDTSVSGVSSRRFACNRCRGQKLRCLREQADQQKCDRCFRADAECRTSPVFRVRSYTGDTALASTNSIGENERAQKRVRMRQYNAPHAQMQSPVITPQTSHEMDTATVIEAMHSAASVEQTTSMNIFEAPSPSSAMLIYPTECTTNDMHWEAEDPSFYDLLLPNAVGETFNLFGDAGILGQKCPSQASTFTQDLASQPRVSLVPPPQMTSSSDSTSGLRDIDLNRKDTLAAPSDGNNICKGLENQISGSVPVDKTTEESMTQRLAKVNLDLVSLFSHIDKGTPTVIVEMLVEPIDESKSPRTRLDDILSSTRDFLETLSLLAGSSRQSSINSSRSSSFPHMNSNLKSNTSRPSHQNHRNSYASGLSGTDDSNNTSPADSTPSSTLSSSGMPCPKLDFASLLLILTSYIHLLRLYVVLFSHIHDFLREISDSDDPSLCPLPGLSFCSFPLLSSADFLESGNLQTKILIQIITSLFERIELLLGLPREFRINSRESGPNGLLSDDEFVDIVRLVFRTQESGQSEIRRGGLKALRRHLKEIKQLLENSIAL